MSGVLVLVDAYSQIFRGYYAIAHLSNSAGEPTNAVFAFARLMLKLEHEFPDADGALVFDCGRVQFRLELNPEYKANRLAMPEELRSQIPAIRELTCAFGWPLLEEPEYEADDLIAGLALREEGEVKIISSDKDLAQLINPRITQLVPDPKNHTWEIRDPQRVEAKFAVRPDQMIDYLALIGDASDNIPGIPGIGPKTAAALLKEHDSIENLLQHPEAIANERQRNLIGGAGDTLERNRRLIRLRTDLPPHCLDRGCCRRQPPDWEKIAAICDRLELRTIRRELPLPRTDDPLPLFAAAEVPAVAPGARSAAPSRPEPDFVQDDLFGDL